MNQLSAMRMFAKVAETLSFTIAAKELRVSVAMVTRSVATLESYLNLRLLNRTTRSVSLTEAGHEYWQGCREVLRNLDTLEANVCSAAREAGGSLKVAAHESFAAAELSDLISKFRENEPRVDFELTVFASTQDLTVGSYDACFVAERRLRNSSLVCRPLIRLRDTIVASPAYLAQREAPVQPADLARHDVLTTSDPCVRSWEFGDAYGAQRVLLRPVLSSSNLLTLIRAAKAGLGIARLPTSLVAAEIQEGSLIPLLEDFELESGVRTLWMLYSGHRYMTPRVRRFIDFSVAHYRRDTPRLERLLLNPDVQSDRADTMTGRRFYGCNPH
ncbi:LysR family transcriptional regulator [Caballeronia sordidicola]|uniref:LysR family transcriptional regulator n=1 Tax=Caballeronia sordidicola TaxID=196367 RepID=A0A158GF44_CABSO|nr:LysR family transcriptional regulator [Caballeronia sordidicola]SAL30010.1 LysR family transcriptional regulator [Caballeronia sordidicola]